MSDRLRIVTLVLLVATLGTLLGCGAAPSSTGGEGGGGSTASPAVPSGAIVAFYGTEIPAGWVLCDGRETATGRLTPDLRDRFVMGLNPATSALGEQGGSVSHHHRGTTGKPNESDESIESGDDEHAANDGHTHDFTTSDANHLPPYVKLVYIMKE